MTALIASHIVLALVAFSLGKRRSKREREVMEFL